MKAIILFGHGSRDPQWREPMDAVANRIRSRISQVQVRCAFLELDTPGLAAAAADVVQAGADSVRVLPMFLGAGRHAREDLPRLLEECRKAHPTVQFEVVPAVGEMSAVLDLIAAIALE